jgi:heme iron utilization protein
VMAETDGTVPPQALPRVALQVQATVLPRDDDAYAAAKAAYLARFPDSAVTFELADFSIVALAPRSARLVAGFGRAHGLAGDALRDWLRS